MSETPNEIWCDTGLYYDYKTDWSEGSWRNNDNCGGVKYVRADRIEELEAQLNLAQRQVVAAEFNLATCKKYRDTYAECDRIGTQAVRELEAKLAEAMKALNDIARQKKTDELETEYDVEVADFEGGYDMCIDLARTTLAELTGSTDE